MITIPLRKNICSGCTNTIPSVGIGLSLAILIIPQRNTNWGMRRARRVHTQLNYLRYHSRFKVLSIIVAEVLCHILYELTSAMELGFVVFFIFDPFLNLSLLKGI